MKQVAHVISHTHWDREWYLPFQGFRRRLVEVMDQLLDLLEQDPDYRYFHLDGQTVPIEDYLEIRPENEARLRGFIQNGRILIGPWYCHPDFFLVSGESLVRNLMRGHRLAARYGPVMKAGHAIDQFGQVSQLPQILQGFNIDNTFWFRGLSGLDRPSEFWWDAPDGSRVLTFHLDDDRAYSNWWYFLRDYIEGAKAYETQGVVAQIAALRDDCRRRNACGALLFLDGVDHAPAWPSTPRAIADANAALDDVELRHSTLPDFIEAARATAPDTLETRRGEMRETNKQGVLNRLFAGTFTSWVTLKQHNQACELLLTQVAEPLAVLAGRHGLPDQRPFLDLAWKYLLRNHPHDSMCGCSVEQAHRDMLYRFDQCRLLAQGVRDAALRHLADRIDTGDLSDNERAFAIFNPGPRTTEETTLVELDLPLDWQHAALDFRTPQGETVMHQLIEQRPWPGKFGLEPRSVPFGDPICRTTFALATGAIGAAGHTTVIARRLERPNHQRGSQCVGPMVAENEFLQVAISADGTLSLFHNESGREYHDLLVFEDGGDAGDGWNYLAPRFDRKITSLGAETRTELLCDGPLLTRFGVTHTLRLPRALAADGLRRCDDLATCEIASTITLRAESPRVEIETTVHNQVRDHILRVLFPTQIEASESAADSAFDVVRRPVAVPETADWLEPASGIHPRQSLVDVSDGQVGLALVSQGLYEYELREDQHRTLAITLLRGCRNVVGQNWDEGAQSLGTFTFRYALYPHEGGTLASNVLRQADLFRAALPTAATHPVRRATAPTPPARALPARAAGLLLEPSSLALTALKPAEEGEMCVVRFFNPTPTKIKATLTLDQRIDEAYLLNLNEELQAAVDEVGRDTLHVEALPHQIVTLGLRLRL